MSLALHTIKSAKGAGKKRKRVGRGNASGHGTYSCRGMKGQRSRSGVSNLKRMGMKKMLLSIPKNRGFKSDKPKNQAVNLSSLNDVFKEGEMVMPASLVKKELIGSSLLPVKILGEGELKVKGLQFEGVKASKSARTQIEKMGGKIEVHPVKSREAGTRRVI